MYQMQITENVSAAVAAMARKVRDLHPLMSVIGRTVVSRTQLGFRLGVDPYGTPWKPLRFRKGRPLRDTARLQRSITHVAGSNFVDVGTNVAYGVVHQFGATVEAGKPPHVSLGGYQTSGSPVLVFPGPGGRKIRAKKVVIPARPFLPTTKLPDAMGDDIVRAINTYLGS